MTFRTTLAAAAALIALGAAPAFAQSGGAGGDSNINNFVRQSPNGMQPQSNGIPTIVDKGHTTTVPMSTEYAGG